MTAHEFLRELDALRVFRHEYVGTNLLDSLEAARLLFPRIRIHYPKVAAMGNLRGRLFLSPVTPGQKQSCRLHPACLQKP